MTNPNHKELTQIIIENIFNNFFEKILFNFRVIVRNNNKER